MNWYCVPPSSAADGTNRTAVPSGLSVTVPGTTTLPVLRSSWIEVLLIVTGLSCSLNCASICVLRGTPVALANGVRSTSVGFARSAAPPVVNVSVRPAARTLPLRSCTPATANVYVVLAASGCVGTNVTTDPDESAANCR